MCLKKGIFIQVMLLLVIPVPTALTGTACSNAVQNRYSVVSICEYDSATGQTVILDTYNAATYGVNKCTCDISIGSSSNTVTVDKYDNMVPGIPGCGSQVDLEIKSTGSKSETDSMTCFVSLTTYDVGDSYNISITWSQDSPTAKSQYCLKLSTDSSITVRCKDILTTTTTISTTTMTTTDDPTTIYETTRAMSSTLSTIVPTTTLSKGLLTTGATSAMVTDTSIPSLLTTESKHPDATTTDLTSTSTYASISESTTTTQGMIRTSTIFTDTSTLPSSFTTSVETRSETKTLTTLTILNLLMSSSTIHSTTYQKSFSTDATSSTHSSTDPSLMATQPTHLKTESVTAVSNALLSTNENKELSTDDTSSVYTSVDLSSPQTSDEIFTKDDTMTSDYTTLSSEKAISTGHDDSAKTRISTNNYKVLSTDDTSSVSTSVDLSSPQTSNEIFTTNDSITSDYTSLSSEKAISTDPDDSIKTSIKWDSLVVIIAVAAASGALVLIIAVIAIVVICRRGSNTPVQRISKENLEGSYNINSSSKDGMKENTLYVSADANPTPHNNADSQKAKRDTYNQYDSVSLEEHEISELNGTSIVSVKAGPIYAAVEKSKKPQAADETQETLKEEIFSTTINGVEIPKNQSYTFEKDTSNNMHGESKNKDKITEL